MTMSISSAPMATARRGVLDLERQRDETGRETRRHGGDFDSAPRERFPRHRDEIGIDAHGGDVGDRWVAGLGAFGLLTELPDLALGVLPLERGQVDH